MAVVLLDWTLPVTPPALFAVAVTVPALEDAVIQCCGIAKGYNLFSADKLLLHIECNSVKPLLAEELEDVHTFMDMFEKEIHLITDMVVDNENLKGDTLIVRLLATNLALT